MAQKEKINIPLKILKSFLPLAAIATIFCGLLYVSVHQVLRQGANDPQIQMAEDASQLLSTGAKVDSVVPQTKIDIAKSLSSFIMIFDKNGTIISTNAVLNGKNPEVPKGVFDQIKNGSEYKVTWQPKDDVRIAAVVTSYNGIDSGYILAGRSLREVEKREDMLTLEVAAAWIVSVVISFIISSIFVKV